MFYLKFIYEKRIDMIILSTMFMTDKEKLCFKFQSRHFLLGAQQY